MKLYWLDNPAFCPLDSALLEKEGTVTLEVLKCRNCSTRYVRVAGQTVPGTVTSISDGFTVPKEVRMPRAAAAGKAAMILNMTVPAGGAQQSCGSAVNC